MFVILSLFIFIIFSPRVIVDLLRLDVSPAAIFNVLQNMALQAGKTPASKKNSQNKTVSTSTSNKKKPPVAAKPKKIRVENQEVTFWCDVFLITVLLENKTNIKLFIIVDSIGLVLYGRKNFPWLR